MRTGSLRAMCRRTGPSAAMSGGRWTRVSHIVPTTASRSLAGHSPARLLACLSLCSWRRESVSVRESACRGRRGGRRCAGAQCEEAGVAMAIGCCTLGWRTIQATAGVPYRRLLFNAAVVQCGICSMRHLFNTGASCIIKYGGATVGAPGSRHTRCRHTRCMHTRSRLGRSGAG